MTSLFTWFDSSELENVRSLSPINGYAERSVTWFEKYILPDFLSDNKHGTLVDIGCAYGYFTKCYAEHFDKVIGIDFSPQRIEIAKTKNARENVEYAVVDITKDVIPHGDYLVTSAVLQHINPVDRRAVFSNLRKALNTNGVLTCYDAISDRDWDGFYSYVTIEWLKKNVNDMWQVDSYEVVAESDFHESINRVRLIAT